MKIVRNADKNLCNYLKEVGRWVTDGRHTDKNECQDFKKAGWGAAPIVDGPQSIGRTIVAEMMAGQRNLRWYRLDGKLIHTFCCAIRDMLLSTHSGSRRCFFTGKKMPKTFNAVACEILSEQKKPLELFDLVDMALVIKPLKAHPHSLAQNIYRLAQSSDSCFVVEEYPSFSLRDYTHHPRIATTGYVTAAYKILLSQRGKSLEIRKIVQLAINQHLLSSDVEFPEFWMYAKLREAKSIFVQRGALRIGLKPQPRSKRSSGKQEVLQAPKEAVVCKASSKSKADVTQNILEANLESILIEQLDKIERGLQLIQRQYICPGIGRIDLLCQDRRGNLVVVELKKFDARTDSIVDQIARYMGYARTHIARKNQKVRGIIVVGSVDEKLRYAVAAIPGLEARVFNVNIE